MGFEQPKKITKAEAERVFATGNSREICETLVAVALNESDWRWVQGACLSLSTHEDWRIRAVTATCLGHVARIHGELDLELVMPRIEALLADAATAGYAETAMDDITMAMPHAAVLKPSGHRPAS